MRLASVLVTAAVLGAGAPPAQAADGPTPTTIAGHYAEVWGRGAQTMLLLPRGGWKADGPGAVQELRPTARRFVAMGWRTITASYAPRAAGLVSVTAAWQVAGRDGPACVYGESSGAHWALMLATRERSVRCVIAAAAPTDLVSWPGQLPPGPGRFEAVRLRATAFGDNVRTLRRWSPVDRWPARDCVNLLQLTARNDPIVPVAQARELDRRARHDRLIRLRAGTMPWVHSRVRAADLAAAWRAVRRMLAVPPAFRGCG